MSKGSRVPSGVRTYGHESMKDKGSKHPSGLGSGLAGVSKDGGGSGGAGKKDFTAKARSTAPSGVVRGDGTERRRGIEVQHKQAKVTQPPTSGSKNFPSGVKQHDGTKAPKSVK